MPHPSHSHHSPLSASDRTGRTPPFAVLALGAAAAVSSLLARGAPPAPYVIQKFAWSGLTFQVIVALVRLRAFDALGPKKKTAAALADELGCRADPLFRLLRCAAQLGLLAADPGPATPDTTRFANTRHSATLRRDHPNEVATTVLLNADVALAATDLADAVKAVGGGVPYERHYGSDIWARMRADPELEAVFSRAMRAADSLAGPDAVAAYGWDWHARIVDVGGAHGSFLAQLLAAAPMASGILFDQPQVVAAARGVWESSPAWAPLLPRVEFAGGSFFDPSTLPTLVDGDVLVLRFILHDWDDGKALSILRSLRTAAGCATVTLCLVETVLRDAVLDPVLKRSIFDVQMLVAVDGRERTAGQWKALLAAGGWALTRVVQSRTLLAVVEAVPA